MLDDLYHRDALAWSERQAALLRRVARGERVNDVDWDHVVEEIEDAGLSELNAARSDLRQVLVHLLKLRGWPDLTACNHWRGEVIAFQTEARDHFAPLMPQKLDLEAIYDRARTQVAPLRLNGMPPRPSPQTCPVTFDQLLTAACADLEAAFDTPP